MSIVLSDESNIELERERRFHSQINKTRLWIERHSRGDSNKVHATYGLMWVVLPLICNDV